MNPSPPFIGVDVVEPDRLKDRLDRTPSLAKTLFTDGELAYCETQSNPVFHLAGRFCAKEAVMKALGLDAWDPLEIEVVGGGREVEVRLHGDAAAVADALSLNVTISMSHVSQLAIAVAYIRSR